MERIVKALEQANRKNDRKMVTILSVSLFLLALIPGVRLDLPARGVILGILQAAAAIAVCKKVSDRPAYRAKQLQKAFRSPQNMEQFRRCAQKELKNPETRQYSLEGAGIELWVTPRWLILIAPQGSLICLHSQISRITRELDESRGVFLLDVTFTDGTHFRSPNDELFDTLMEWQYPCHAE